MLSKGGDSVTPFFFSEAGSAKLGLGLRNHRALY